MMKGEVMMLNDVYRMPGSQDGEVGGIGEDPSNVDGSLMPM
jgi:hypothetical protein